ncbi:terminase [Metarhizobium album]|uniref:Terminase n=1 Tax=Metarhizobium album TaxID=2182425 RepID=A0A2U2DTZ0_9HYPH|nr:terminase [Rhizobium album]PWE56778.1 terminase [Rhizobium album]
MPRPNKPKATPAEEPQAKQGRGRPSSYKKEFAGQAKKLCALGATDFELADFFGVDTRTIYRWRIEHEDFCQAVVVGKDSCDERVKRSLFNRAVGYSFESEKVFNFQGAIVRASTVEHVPPDPGAAFNWLKNRQPDEWREKLEVTHNLAELSDEELDKELMGMLTKPGK